MESLRSLLSCRVPKKEDQHEGHLTCHFPQTNHLGLEPELCGHVDYADMNKHFNPNASFKMAHVVNFK